MLVHLEYWAVDLQFHRTLQATNLQFALFVHFASLSQAVKAIIEQTSLSEFWEVLFHVGAGYRFVSAYMVSFIA